MTCVARLRVLLRRESGAAAVEFALIGLVAIAMFLGIIEFGRALYVRNELSYAVDVAARRILTDPAVADSDLEEAIRSSLTFGDQGDLRLTLGTETADGVSFRTVMAEQPLLLLVPLLVDADVTLKVDRRVPVP